jgi:hypothetical protein
MEENANCQIFVNVDDLDKAGIPLDRLDKNKMDQLRKETEKLINFRLPLFFKEVWAKIERERS